MLRTSRGQLVEVESWLGLPVHRGSGLGCSRSEAVFSNSGSLVHVCCVPTGRERKSDVYRASRGRLAGVASRQRQGDKGAGGTETERRYESEWGPTNRSRSCSFLVLPKAVVGPQHLMPLEHVVLYIGAIDESDRQVIG